VEEQYDSSNIKHVKKAKKRAKLIEEKMARGMVKICEDKDIRFVINAFFDEVGIFRDEPRVETPDYIYEHGRNAGLKSAGNWWLTQALLNDREIISKLEQDKEENLI